MTAKKSRSSFSFGGKVSKGIQQEKDKFQSFGYLNLPPGVEALKIDSRTIKLDFMPYEVTDDNHPERNDDEQLARPGDLWWRRPFRVHKNVGPDEETVVCPRSFNMPCPICEHVKQLADDGADREELRPLRSKGRYLYAVIPINHKKLDEEVMVWDYSYSLFEKQLDEELENDRSFDRFPGLEDGLTLEIRFREEKFGRGSYWETSRINFLDREEYYTEDILDDVPNLDECLKVLSYKELEALFFDFEPDVGETDTEDSNEDIGEDESPEASQPPARKPKTAKRAKKPSEDEAEKQQETKPKKARTRGTKKEQPPAEDECPHGYEFGADNDKYDECEDCDVWDSCNEARKKN